MCEDFCCAPAAERQQRVEERHRVVPLLHNPDDVEERVRAVLFQNYAELDVFSLAEGRGGLEGVRLRVEVDGGRQSRVRGLDRRAE